MCSGDPRSERKVSRQGEERKRKEGQGAARTQVRGSKSLGSRGKEEKEWSEEGKTRQSEDKVKRGRTVGAQSHQAGRGTKEKEWREKARTRCSGDPG